ncbi:unnamed protein product, partial [Discosporangium mesarthrocarpum]
QIVTLKPRTNPIDLTRIFRKLASQIVDNGGVVRSVHNHGIRPCPYRFHSKHAVGDESRWFSSGRWVSAYYDANPEIMDRMEKYLWKEDRVLRVTTLKPRVRMDAITSMHSRSNPWDIELRAR